MRFKYLIGIVLALAMISFFVIYSNDKYSSLSASAVADITTGLVSSWKFNEGTGTVAYDSAGSNNGNLVNGPAWTAGKLGNALSFDGINDKVSVTTSGSINSMNDITITGWIYPRSSGGGGYGRIIRKGNTIAPDGNNMYWEISVGSNTLHFRAGYSTSFGDWVVGGIPFNQWTQVAVTYTHGDTSADPLIYINGVLQTATEQTTPAGTKLSDTSSLVIGDWGNGARVFDGVIDEVRVFNRLLSAGDISALYSVDLGGSPDAQAPITSILSPASGSTVSGSVIVTATASDNVAVARVELWKDNVLFLTDNFSPYSFVWDTTASANGPHLLQTKAYDAAGNVGISPNVAVTVSNVVPGITLDFTTVYQTIRGVGGNYGRSRYVGLDARDTVGDYNLVNLKPPRVRIGIPLKGWEPINDNSDPRSFDWSKFKDSRSIHDLFVFMQELNGKGIPIYVYIQDTANWMVSNPTAGKDRIIPPSNYDEAIESIAAFLLRARDNYGVTIDYVSFNEPDIGGHIKISPTEVSNFIVKSGVRFAELGLSTKWFVDGTSAVASIAYARPLLENAAVRPYIGPVSFHSVGTDANFASLIALAKLYGREVWATEANDGIDYTTTGVASWDTAEKVATLYYRLIKHSQASVLDYWQYQDGFYTLVNPTGLVPYHTFYVVKQLADNLPPGSQVIRTVSGSGTSGINVIAAKHPDRINSFMAQMINTNSGQVTISLKGIPNVNVIVQRTSSTEDLKTIGTYDITGSQITLALPARSITTVSYGMQDTSPALSLISSPTSIASGESATLIWSATGATSCTASGAWSEAKAMSGTQIVSPMVTSTYTLTCTTSSGSMSKSSTVPIITILPSTKFNIGDRVKLLHGLNPTFTGVRAAPSIYGTILGTQTSAALGTVIGGPIYADRYHWWQINYDTAPDGWTFEDYLEVEAYNPSAPTLAFSASPSSIISGSSSTLTWSSTGATSCTASGAWSEAKATSGTQTVSPTTTSTYTLTCTGSGGSDTKSATVTVTPISGITSTLNADGSFFWLQAPHAIRFNDKTYVAWTTKEGDAVIASFNHVTKKTTSVTLHNNLQVDDHAMPSLFVLPDGRILVFYASNRAQLVSIMKYRVSKNPEDITSWNPEKNFDKNTPGNSGFAYPNIVQLSGESNALYLFWRGGNWNPSFSKSTDGGSIWSAPQTLVSNPGQRPYIKFASNGIDKIYFAFTTGGPGEVGASNSLYFAYYQGGSLYRANGAFIKNVAGLPLLLSDADKVYDAASGLGAVEYIHDIAFDSSGKPIIIYATYTGAMTTPDYTYRYARWDGTAWRNFVITAGGKPFPTDAGLAWYAGGITLDHSNPSIVYLSKEVGSSHEIQKWTTSDGGATWTLQSITFGSTSDNYRPIVPRGHTGGEMDVLWSSGRYTSYRDFDASIKAYPLSASSDISAPVITNLRNEMLGMNSAPIAWSTSEPATTQIEYGTTSSFGSMTSEVSTLATTHSQPLTTLLPGTTYYYRVKSKDVTGNLAISGESTFVTAASSAPTNPFLEAGGKVTIEAEHYEKSISRDSVTWTKGTTTAGYASDGYMEALPNTGKICTDYTCVGTSAELQYQIKFSNPGTYLAWVRGYGASAADDTVHFGLDGIASYSDRASGFSPSWAWSGSRLNGLYPIGVTLYVTTAGLHTLNVWMSEDGFKLDKIYLTRDTLWSTPAPSGIGPPESPRYSSALPPTVTISASPSSIISGSSSTLTWSSTGVTSCSASDAWSGTKTTSGNQIVNPIVTSTYTLTCTGSDGSDTKSATVTVIPIDSRPNILLIMTDDQHDGDSLSVMPNVQNLIVNKGIRFTNSFVDFPLCCPSRATLLTGQYSHNHLVRGNGLGSKGGYETLKPTDANTLPVWMSNAGYYTEHIGKYLNGYGNPTITGETYKPPGWNDWFGIVDNPTNYITYLNYKINDNGTVVSYGSTDASYQTDVLAKEAIDFINRRKDSSQPFFLSFAPFAPHADKAYGDGSQPRPATRHLGLYSTRSLPRPPNFNESDVSDKPPYVATWSLIDTPAELSKTENIYRARLESLVAVDEGIASIISALQAAGKLDNTIIIFTSDNGFFHGEHRKYIGKYWLYEESIRVPFAIRGPGIPQGQTRAQLINNVDIPATILDYASAAPGRTLDGKSLKPVFADSSYSWRTAFPFQGIDNVIGVTSEALDRFRAIHTKNYVYAEHSDTNYVPNSYRELYDLSVDPYQLQSRHADPLYSSVKSDLASKLAILKTCAGSSCWMTSPEPPGPGIDTTAPTVSITSPLTGATVSSTITISATASDDTGVIGVQFKLDGNNLGAEDTTSPYSLSWDTKTATNGVHTLTATARDAAGNTKTSASISVTVSNTGDTTAPTVLITSPSAGATVSSTFTVSATASDDTGVFGVQFKLDVTNLGTEDTTSPYAISWDTKTATNGLHTLTATARDAAGNTGSNSISVTVNNADLTPPIISNVEATSITINSAAIMWDTDEASDSQVEYGTTTAYGSSTLLSTAKTTTHSVILNGLISNTLYHYRVKSKDASNNLAVSSDFTFTTLVVPDTTPPLRSDPSPGGVLASGISATTLSLKTDENANCKYSTSPNIAYSAMTNAFSTTGTSVHATIISGLSDGNLYKYYVRCIDTAGNPNNNDFIIEFSVATDTTAPTVSITSPLTGATVSSTITISATASDDTGVVGVQFKLDGSNLGVEDTTSPYSLSWDTKTATNGVHTLTATARDAAGNTKTSASISVTVLNADTIDPTVSITSPSSGATLTGTITIASTASDNVGVAGVQFKLDGSNLGTEDTASPYSYSFDTRTTTNGLHTLTAVARDAAGNTKTSAPISVTVSNLGDIIDPTVSITAPSSGAAVANTISVTASASDNVGVVGVQFKLDEIDLGLEDTLAPYSISWDTKTATNGLHTLTATARDAAGNAKTSAGISITVTNIVTDEDSDGISDAIDKCQKSTGPIDKFGCPLPKRAKFTSDLTTDFANSDLSNLLNLKIGITNYGYIDYGDNTINLTKDTPTGFVQVDLDSLVEILENKVIVRSELFNNLNKSATITLDLQNINSPLIMKDSSNCADCRILSYISKQIKFTVPHFSEYAVEEGSYCGDAYCSTQENCSGCSSDCGACPISGGFSGGGGSGGGGSSGGGGGSGGSSGGGGSTGFVCNMDWQCGSWNECDGKWQTRTCNFIKVPQHTQNTPCPDMINMPKISQKCQKTIAKEETETQNLNIGGEKEPVKDELTDEEIKAEIKQKSSIFTKFFVIGAVALVVILIIGIGVYEMKSKGRKNEKKFANELIIYVDSMRRLGRPDEEIINALVDKGWNEDLVREIIRKK